MSETYDVNYVVGHGIELSAHGDGSNLEIVVAGTRRVDEADGGIRTRDLLLTGETLCR